MEKETRRFLSSAIEFLVADFLGNAYSGLSVLSGGVMVAQGPLEALVMVRVHAGQPIFPFPNFCCIFGKVDRMDFRESMLG